MGQWNAERWAPEAWRAGTETVGQMRANRWEVTSRCDACGLAMRVDLGLIEKVKGPGVSLWNRRAPCRRLGCEGQVRFIGRPPIVSRPFFLEADRPRRGADASAPPPGREPWGRGTTRSVVEAAPGADRSSSRTQSPHPRPPAGTSPNPGGPGEG